MKAVGIFGKTQAQRLWITSQFFNINGLANHAGAGAFGFLLSAAPVLLLTAFFLSAAFLSSPQAVHQLIKQIPFMEIAFDEEWLTKEFQIFSLRGIPAILSVLSIFWAGRIFAASLHRGLKVIFTGVKKRKTITDNLLIFLIETLALIFAVVMILCSKTSIQFYEALGYIPESFLALVSNSKLYLFQITGLWIVSYCVFRISSANAPSRRAALGGSLCTVISYWLLSSVFEIIINQGRYYFLYGALGNLIVFLLNVYFFFVFFFFGAQLAFVIDNFDALLFAQFRKIREAEKPSSSHKSIRAKLFNHVDGKLKKYLCKYAKGEIIFSKGDGRKEIYYLLEGEVEVLIPAAGNTGTTVAYLITSSFFGEMGHLLSEDRSATVKAKTDISVLALPPKLFDKMLKYEPGFDRAILEELSQRLKDSNEKISSLVESSPAGAGFHTDP